MKHEEPDWVGTLRRARALIQRGHTKNVLARLPSGSPTAPTDRSAVEWCVQGAIMAADDRLYQSVGTAINALQERLNDELGGPRPLYAWNNDPERTPEEVCALIDRVIGPYQK